MKYLKISLSILLVMIIALTLAPGSSFAADAFSYNTQAQTLNDLGLYKGISETSFDPDLGSALNRETGVVMLLRIFGLEEQAQALADAEVNTALAKFSDAASIDSWAKASVAYAVQNGLVNGLPDGTFAPQANLAGKAYCTMILRQLGFTPDYDTAAAELADKGGLTPDQAVAFDGKALIKDDLVGISFGALSATDKEDVKVIDQLIGIHTVTEEAAIEAGLVEPAPQTQTPNGSTTGSSGSSGHSHGSSNVAVSAITVTGTDDATTVANGETLQMIATVTPANATDQTVIWSVAPAAGDGAGTATIDATTGVLTGTGIGTVTVTATNAASGVPGTKDITVTIGNQAAPTGLTGVAPTTLYGSDGKITGTTIAMEYKLSTEPQNWTPATETESTGLVAGTYQVRYAAKDGYNAGTAADVAVFTDSFEADDSYQTATLIAIGTNQKHVIYPAGDEDWLKFVAEDGNIYHIVTSNLIKDPNNQDGMDSVVELYNTDGTSLICYDDDSAGNLASEIYWHCSTTGTYYLRIIHYTKFENEYYDDPDYDDDGTGSYDISITTAATTATLNSIAIYGTNYYTVGDSPELFVLGTYSDDSTAFETITAANITGFDSSKAVKNQTVTVSFGGKTNTYIVNIGAAKAATPIEYGTLNPSTDVSLTGDTFKAEAIDANNWEIIFTDTTGLSHPVITLQGVAGEATSVTISFTGTAAAGTIYIQPRPGALTSGVAGNCVAIEITASDEILLAAAENAVTALETAITTPNDLTVEADLEAAEALIDPAEGAVEAAVGVTGIDAISGRLTIAEDTVTDARTAFDKAALLGAAEEAVAALEAASTEDLKVEQNLLAAEDLVNPAEEAVSEAVGITGIDDIETRLTNAVDTVTEARTAFDQK